MRIAMSGAGGTGKGTMGKLLADKLGLPFLNSPGTKIGQDLGMATYRSADEQTQIIMQHAYLYGIIYQEIGALAAGDGYVSERSALDVIPYYHSKKLPNVSRYD